MITPREALPLSTIPITISAGQSLSDSVAVGSKQPVALIAPDDWDPARLSFQLSLDGTTFYDVSGATTYLKIRSGHPIQPVPQSADRVFSLVIA